MLTLNETEHQQNTSKKMGNSREEKKNKSHKRSKHTNSGRKLRSSVDFVPHKIETQEEDESMELSYLGKDPSVSSQIKMEASENENEYIILSHLESMKGTVIGILNNHTIVRANVSRLGALGLIDITIRYY